MSQVSTAGSLELPERGPVEVLRQDRGAETVPEVTLPEVRGRFSVVVPVLNAKDFLRRSLDSILAAMNQYGNAELVVLDNGSSDGSYEILLQEYGSRARILQIRGVTVAGLRNFGARLTDGEFLTFIDSDCYIATDYFDRALEVLRTHGDATGSKCALDDSASWIETTWHTVHSHGRDGVVNYINSGNLVIKRDVFLQVRGFDESMIACEDTDLCARMQQVGYKIYEARAVRAVHAAGDRTLRIFFRKHAWRSMGMFGMLKNEPLNKPVVITFVHLLLCILAVGILFATPIPLYLRLSYFLFLLNLAPAVTIAYRVWQMKRLPPAPLRAMFLYDVYFLARFYAMWKLALFWRASAEERNNIGADLHG